MTEVIKVVVYGKVQKIGYRYFVQRYAKILGLKGYVRNLPDNKVEAVFVGEKEDIEKMLEIMRKSHPLARVEKMETERLNTEVNFQDFEIIF
ncbi:MAG: acylphosphatase [Candidatus Aenigmarchaeota archaeon]|nr:acylphosphatase [Candidatus Aenigmarchaeota archaeon]MCX8190926.1 acylphosphatase [Candidatus Aenigmarchaeota archaeon]MDW8160119.1 acylphosphatase [Candidatus Aenigmarchaeota archaeon]